MIALATLAMVVQASSPSMFALHNLTFDYAEPWVATITQAPVRAVDFSSLTDVGSAALVQI